MEFQTLKGSRNKKIVIGVIVFITIISMIFIGRSYASYRTTQSVNIANGKINYKVPDLRVVAIKLQDETDNTIYNDSNTIPTSGYILNTDKSVCGQPDGNGYATKDSNIAITYDDGTLLFVGLKKNTRCYLYFDISDNTTKYPIASMKILSDNMENISVGSTSISAVSTTDEGIKYISDGMYGNNTYYYRGAVNNNWVKFAGYYWRIIRINGDGSIRMIYSGTTAPTEETAKVMTGTGTQTTTKAFNSSYNNAIYVGFKYASSNGHGTSSWSTIADYLVGTGSGGWYSSSGLSSYASYITDGKFCNDRTTNGSYFSGYTSTTGYGTTSTTAFAPATRIIDSGWSFYGAQTATTACSNSNDIFTTKVGLITSDEVLMAGGKGGTNNTSYYLYTNQNYWTMSPNHYDGGNPFILRVNSDGKLHFNNRVNSTLGVRPVINLKAGTTFTGSGTYDDVYKVVGTDD